MKRCSPFIPLNPEDTLLEDQTRGGKRTRVCLGTHIYCAPPTHTTHFNSYLHSNTVGTCKSHIISQGFDLHILPSHNTPLLNFMIDFMSDSFNRDAIFPLIWNTEHVRVLHIFLLLFKICSFHASM